MARPIQPVGSREIAAGTITYTRLTRSDSVVVWNAYEWRRGEFVRAPAETRCPAHHPDNEMQCDFEIHDGDEHEFNNPISWVACVACQGGAEYHPEFGGEVIAHEPGCPKVEAAQEFSCDYCGHFSGDHSHRMSDSEQAPCKKCDCEDFSSDAADSAGSLSVMGTERGI